MASNNSSVFQVFEEGMVINRLCRICYNDRGYVEPSGRRGKSSNKTYHNELGEDSSGAYEARKGFGHEEWLANEVVITSARKGWCQGFIQQKGQPADVEFNAALWTRFSDKGDKDHGKCWLVGFVVHLNYVGCGGEGTKSVQMALPKGIVDDEGSVVDQCVIKPNILYPKGCLKILPRKFWVEIPRKLIASYHYVWLKREKSKNQAIFDWVQTQYQEFLESKEVLDSTEGHEFEAGGQVEHRLQEDSAAIQLNSRNDPATIKCMAKVRTRQAKFRGLLMNEARGKCMVTGVAREELLVASHILPFSYCLKNKNALKLVYDKDNGLLLAAHVDAFFDAFLISFDAETGELVRAPGVDEALLKTFGINPASTRIAEKFLTKTRRRNLQWHNKQLAVKKR